MPAPTYLDHLATTPVDPRVLEEMLPYFTERFGHPGSGGHAAGWEAERGLEVARARVADFASASPAELVFTSGGTEASNLAILGLAARAPTERRHLLASAVEGPAVMACLRQLAGEGFEVGLMPVDASGRVDVAALRAAVRDDTLLVCLQAANEETGVRQDVETLASELADHTARLFVDATALGLTEAPKAHPGIDLMALTAHRMHGPKGAGALFVSRARPRLRLSPRLLGGEREGGLRAGTPDVAALVGFGMAAELCRTSHETEADRLASLRDSFEARLAADAGPVHALGQEAPRLPRVSNLVFEGVEGEALVTALTSLAFSTGSRCTTGSEPSWVLPAMGLDKTEAAGSVRFSFARTTTSDDIDTALRAIVPAVARLRELAPGA